MQALRTPDERFEGLPGYSFRPHYVDSLRGYEGLRMHYLDESPASSPVMLCLHGQPTWSYLYRRMIPRFSAAGLRSVVPDLFGFGRSDKPVDEAVYTLEWHRQSLIELIKALDLERITLVCQDWGGLLGLTIPMEMPERFERLLVMNTGLGTGTQPLTPGFLSWRAYNRSQHDLPIGSLLRRSCPHLSEAEAKAYDAPFPDATYKAGVRRFPDLVPEHATDPGAEVSRAAAEFWRTQWNGQTFMAIGMQDPVLTPPTMHALAKLIRGCPAPFEHAEAGHFVQEWGETVADRALAAFAR
jgi:pimeloyl-ACP methyl ester carboxylesterase